MESFFINQERFQRITMEQYILLILKYVATFLRMIENGSW